MRADAARNLEAVLTTEARMLAADPGTSIATEAGMDRHTVYRRFASREELLAAIYESRVTAIEEAIEDARLREAPVTVALHRYVENIAGQALPDEEARRRLDLHYRVGAAERTVLWQESQIAGLAAIGPTNKEIGQRMHLSPHTVSSRPYRVGFIEQ